MLRLAARRAIVMVAARLGPLSGSFFVHLEEPGADRCTAPSKGTLMRVASA